LEDKIRRCLDYVTKKYKNEASKSTFFEFIDLKTVGGLLDDRAHLVENIQNLQDLGE